MTTVREADLRVGTSTSRYVEYSADRQGAEVRYYASRWRVDAGRPIVFYLDSVFLRHGNPISNGVYCSGTMPSSGSVFLGPSRCGVSRRRGCPT
ncbi:MAG: DUF5117 domain-containing protein [Alistipes senegalensis]